jgi:hypothetical protein
MPSWQRAWTLSRHQIGVESVTDGVTQSQDRRVRVAELLGFAITRQFGNWLLNVGDGGSGESERQR